MRVTGWVEQKQSSQRTYWLIHADNLENYEKIRCEQIYRKTELALG
jgi:hypothetical protein